MFANARKISSFFMDNFSSVHSKTEVPKLNEANDQSVPKRKSVLIEKNKKIESKSW